MDNSSQTTQPINDDQELAKVLAGINNQSSNNLDFEETPAPVLSPSTIPVTEPVDEPEPVDEKPEPETTTTDSGNDDLDSIKKDALIALRPLVDKLELQADEKFNIYLLLLRSTDDKSLIAPAHKAASEITDESKRAQALLDIIKEIDYLSTNK
jgi:hypothetical protein